MIRHERGLTVFGKGAASGGGGVDVPVLSNPTDGTPTADGTNNATVDSTAGSGRLYWAVVTDGGSCTDAQLVAGSGGNIVEGIAGSQAITASGTQTVASITGLAAATTYQIKFIVYGGNGVYSAQASVELITTA